jgi:hypothetical protein
VVDLGCGPASLLVGMASRHPAFTGIGVDANPAMCAAAEEAIVRRGVEGQVTILEGDALAVLATLPEGTRRQVTAIYGRSFFNACFGRGPAQAVDAVRRLAGLFPGRLVVVDDYYGELERCPTGRSPDHRAACLQDLVQVWSGQGVPPGDRDGWAAVYAAGNARLRRSYEGDADGFRRFVHVVELDGAGSR